MHQKEDREHISSEKISLCFMPQDLQEVEINYAYIEKEFLAIAFRQQKLKQFIYRKESTELSYLKLLEAIWKKG